MYANKLTAAAAVLILLTVMFFTACSTPAGRSAGTVVDDSTITSKVKYQLLRDEELSGIAVSVETFQGEVTLTGAVDSPEQKERATELAQSVQGVTDVNNLLKIQ